MKTRKSKRLLAAFLAAIMVLTTLSVLPFSSYAAEHSPQDLKNLIDQVESRLEGETGTVYTNVSNTYEAWYSAYRTYVGVLSGVTDASKVDTAYDELQTQFAAMQPWTPYKGTASAAEDGSYTADLLVDNDEMANVLYAYGVGANSQFADVLTDDGGAATETRAGVQYGTTVLLYDGITTPAFPVSMYTARYTNLAQSGTRSMRPTTAPFALVKNWHGYSNTVGYQQGVSSFVGFEDNSDYLSNLNASNNSPDRYSNTLYWTGDTSTFGSNNILTYNTQEWITYNEDRNSGTFSITSDIYVVNYKQLIDFIQNIHADACSYNYSTASRYFAALEDAMAFDPQPYFTGATRDNIPTIIAEFGSDFNRVLNAVRTANNSLSTKCDFSSYIQLANLVAAYKPIYDSDNQDGMYEDGSFNTFKTRFNSSWNALDSICNGTTAFSTATNFINSLSTAYSNLKTTGDYIDASALTAQLQEFSTLNSAIYTQESYAAASAACTEALQYYSGGTYAGQFTLREEDRAVYEQQLASVTAAMDGLRISHDAVVPVLATQLSYNQAVNYAATLNNAYKYTTYASAMETVAEATRGMNELDDTAFTDQNTLLQRYTEIVTSIATALRDLQGNIAFTGIEDGTVIRETVGSTDGYTANDIKSYLYNQKTSVTYFKTVSGTSSYVTEYDITFNNHWYEWSGDRGAQLHALGFGAYGQDTVSTANGTMSVQWLPGGAAWSSPVSSSYHAALMKQPGSVTNGSDFIDIVAATDGTVVNGETTVTVGDLGISYAPFTTPALYEYYRVRTGNWFNSGEHKTEERQNDNVHQTVTVLDISMLVELVKEATALVGKYQNNAFNCVDPTAWATFSDALEAAMAPMDYASMGNDDIVAQTTTRYNNLNAAMQHLPLNDAEDAHNYILQSSTSDDACAHYICNVCGDELVYDSHDDVYTSNNDGSTHTHTCTRCSLNKVESCTDANSDLYCDLCGQPLYEPADFTQFNAAKAQLEALLADAQSGAKKFTVAALEDTNFIIVSARYYNYTEAEQKTVRKDPLQSAVDQQTQDILRAVELLNQGLTEADVYEAYQRQLSTLNADAYYIESIQEAVSSVGDIAVPGIEVNGKTYTGYNYDSFNTAFATALNEYWIPYQIEVYDVNSDTYYVVKDEEGNISYSTSAGDASDFRYGEEVTLVNPVKSDEECGWETYVYTDRLDPNAQNTYQGYDTSYTFNVRGYTEVYTTAAGKVQNMCKVEFLLGLDGVNTGKRISVMFVDSGSTIRTRDIMLNHNIPFYTLDDYYVLENGELGSQFKFGASGTKVTSRMEVVVNYESVASTDYLINIVDESGVSMPDYTTNGAYNELISIAVPDAVAYINHDNGKVLCYGSEYEFHACRDVDIEPVYEISEKTASVDICQPVLDQDEGITYLVGSFALPDGAEIQSWGFVMRNPASGTPQPLSLADLSDDQLNMVLNLSASKYTNPGQNGNQFIVSFTSSKTYPNADLVAYAIYELDGVQYYEYSEVLNNVAVY